MLQVSKTTISHMTVQKASGDATPRELLAYADLRICFVLHGSAIWQINEKKHPIAEGDIVFLNHRQKRCFVSYGATGLSLVAITLDRRVFANPNHFSFFLTCIREADGVFHNTALCALLHEIYNELANGRSASYPLISAKLTELFIKAERSFGFDVAATVKVDKSMFKVLDYIDAHVTEKISLSDAAALAGFTESSFSRHFAKVNGISFKKYVMSKKIEHAIYLLENTDQKVIDVAFECGFDSISGFYDTFRKITGTTPNKFTYIV